MTVVNEPQVVSGNTLGFYLTKNRNYLGIILPEYALFLTGEHKCSGGLYNQLNKYKDSYRIKYSNQNLDKFFVGSIDFILNEDETIKTIHFKSVTEKNRWGWNFSCQPNDFETSIEIRREDMLWLWKDGFVLVQFKECGCDEDIDILHQFVVLYKPPYGLGSTNAPHYPYLGRDWK